MTIELAVTVRGDGPPVAVLHGFTGDGTAMAPLVELLEPHRRVVAVDLIGHGRSPRPDGADHYSMHACVEQVARALAAYSPLHVVGYSMGGRVALALAAERADLVSRLTLIGARAGFADPDARAARVAADERLARRIVDDGLEAFVDSWMAQPLFETQSRLGTVALAAGREQRLRNDPQALANSLIGMGSGAMPPLHEALGAIAVPVDVVVGADDTRFAPVADELVELLPQATLRIVDGAGHAAHLERPHDVAAIVLG